MLRKIAIFPIRLYQKYLSPFKKAPSCKFYPTCSTYAIQSITKYGVIKGGLKALWRLLRCNPFSSGGYDPLK